MVDFYSLLGVPRTASGPDVERAYRRLARRYHPGVNPGDRVAEEMYQHIQEAYRVLADAERRGEYDRGRRQPAGTETSVAFAGFDFSAPAEGPLAATFSELFADVFQQAAREAITPTRGADVALSIHVPFVDAMRGCQVPLSVTRHERCTGCSGAGQVGSSAQLCAECRGEGTRRWARGHMVFSKSCDACGGGGHVANQACRTCRGVGVTPRTEVVTLSIPPGIEHGARIAVPGRGDAGALGGPSGDLYVTVEVGTHPFFRRLGADLHLVLPTAVHEAALGAVVDVPTLTEPLRVRIPPGVASGQSVRIAGHGVPVGDGGHPGDLVISFELVLPPTLDERSRELMREFGRLNGGDVRQSYFSQE